MSLNPSYKPAQAIRTLGEGFFDPVEAATFPKLILRFRNQPWAERIGLSDLSDEEWLKHFAEFEALPHNIPHPLALRYHGHQFRQYNPDLGDGRGFLFAQMLDPVDQRLLDLGTKGSGTTPYSRGGDGRLTLKGGVRELLATEMLEALGVSTSKTFSIIETGENLRRHDEPSPTRSCVMVRLSHSHIRFGSFQRHSFEQSPERLAELMAYTIEHYYPHLLEDAPETRPVSLLREVVHQCADTCAAWMTAGFVHGVLNTDNMNITGESFDYGPYRFAPSYDPSFVAAYFDHRGLYAFGRQSEAVYWNLQKLAVALRPLAENEAMAEILTEFENAFDVAFTQRFLERLGVRSKSPREDTNLREFAIQYLEDTQMSYDQFFFDWYGGMASKERANRSPAADNYKERAFQRLSILLPKFEPSNASPLEHPYFQQERPCSMLIDEIEEIWSHIDERDDWKPLYKKIESIREMGEAVGI